jgi:hypothetical protein
MGSMTIITRSHISAEENAEGHAFNANTNVTGMMTYELQDSMKFR